MNRIKIIQLFFFFVALPVMSLSVTDLSAQQIDETEVTIISEKPMSFAQYIRSNGSAGFISDDSPEGPVTEEEIPSNQIIVSLDDQTMFIFEGGRIIQRFLVSTGTWGHRTPTGNFQVRNQALRAYSEKYDAWMLHWMAITPNGAYGMHSLQGTSYLRRLGSVASHGCIRLSHEDAEWLYGWVESGTPVQIVDDFLEPPEEKTLTYRTGKLYCF